jgi:type IV pilus assembly protein PilO
MTILRPFLRIPYLLWFLVAGGWAYMDHQEWITTVRDPMLAQVQSKKSELEAKKREVAKVEEFRLTREQKLRELQELNEQLEATKSSIPRSSSIPDLLRELADISDQVGLEFSRFKPSTPIVRQFLVESPIEVTLQGTYVQVMSFLDMTANLQRVVATKKLVLDNPSQRGSIRMVTANAVVSSFHLEEVGAVAGAAAGGAPGAPKK